MIRMLVKTYVDAYRGLPRAAWILALIEFVNRSGTMVLFYLTLYLTRHLAYSPAQAGLIMSGFGAGALLGAYLGGVLCDRLGPRNVQQLSLALSGVNYIAILFVSSFPALFAIMMTLGIVSEALHPANATAMSEVCPPEIRTRAYALHRLAINLGMTVGPVVGGYLALHSYRSLFWVDGLTSLAAAGLFGVFFPYRRRVNPVGPPAGAPRIKSAWRDIPFVMSLALVFGIGTIFVQLINAFPLYMRTVYSLPENYIGQLVAINTVLIVLFEMVLMDRLQRRTPLRVVAIGGFLLGAGFALMPLGRGFLFAALTVVVWTAGEMLTMPILTSTIANRSTDASRGQYMGLFSLAFSAALAVGPAVGLWIYQEISPEAVWFGCGGIGIALWLGFTRLGRSWGNQLGEPKNSPDLVD